MSTVEEPASSTPLIRNVRALGWLLAAMINILMGAWLLQRNNPPGPPPLIAFILFLVAALILVTTRSHEPAQQARPPASSRRQASPVTDHALFQSASRPRSAHPWRILLLAISVLCALYTLLRIPALGRLGDYTGPFLAWLFSIILYALALAPPRNNPLPAWLRRTRLIWQQRRLALLLFLGIVLLAALARIPFLASIPYTLGGDEASQGLEAVRVLQGEIRNPFTTGWLGVPTLSFFFNSLTVDLLGMNKVGLRLPWALVGSATVVATFFLVRRLQGLTLALATSALLAAYHYHIHFSRLGSNQIADPLFVALSLFCLFVALDRRQTAAWIVTGAVTGLALYFYAGARFTPVVLLTVLALTMVWQRGAHWRRRLRGILAMSGAFLLVAAPMLQFALRFPDEFNARLNQVGIIQSGWLERELAAGRQLLPTLWEQFHRALLAFHYYPDRTAWYGLQEPLLDPLFGALFAVGLLLATFLVLSRRGPRLMPFVVWWWGGIVAGGVLTESPPSAQRLTTLTVPTCFFIAFALWHLIGLARAAIPRLPRRLLLAGGVLAFMLLSLNLYFLEFTPQHRYGGRHAELATTLAPIFDELHATHDAYFIGAPWMYWGFATIPYLSPEMKGQDIIEPLQSPPTPRIVPPGRGGVFIVRPERAAELALIQQTFPRAQVRELHSRAPEDELLATLVIVPPQTAP